VRKQRNVLDESTVECAITGENIGQLHFKQTVEDLKEQPIAHAVEPAEAA
jgi:hypothetical protein